MKKTFLSISLLFAVIISNAQFTSARLTAAGLTCAMCTKAIFNSLEKLPSVSKVEPDIANSAFTISFKNGAAVDPDVLKGAVEEAGFSVSKLNLTGSFSNVQIGKDAHVVLAGNTYHFMGAGKNVLNGQQTLQVVDRKFLSAREFKKYGAAGHACLESGKAEHCCPQGVAVNNRRIYHVTL
jgi:copper chaperone CopZ